MTSAEVNFVVIFYLLCGCLIVGIIWHALDKEGDVAAADRAQLTRFLVAAVLLVTVWPFAVVYYTLLDKKR